MWNFDRKFTLIGAVCVACLLLAAGGCTGFFVNPTVSTVTVSPSTNNLQLGATRQLSAIATNSDGSTKDVTGLAIWDTSNSALVSVTSSGLVKALQTTSSTVTITATYKVSGQATVTVGAQTLTIQSSLGTSVSLATDPAGTAIIFTATQNGSDVTSTTTFTTSNASIISVSSSNSSQGQIVGNQGTVTITANNGGASGSIQVTVGP